MDNESGLKLCRNVGKTCRIVAWILKIFTIVFIVAAFLLSMMAFAMPEKLLKASALESYEADVDISQLGLKLNSKNISAISKVIKKTKEVALEEADSKGLKLSYKVKKKDVTTKNLGLFFITLLVISILFFVFLCGLNRLGKGLHTYAKESAGEASEEKRPPGEYVQKPMLFMTISFCVWYLLKGIPACFLTKVFYPSNFLIINLRFSDFLVVFLFVIVYNLLRIFLNHINVKG